jgi:hypothetical protein
MTDQWHFEGRGTPRSSARRLRWALEHASSCLDSCCFAIPASLPNAAGVISARWGYHSSPVYYVVALHTAWQGTARAPRVGDRAAEQRDAADEGRLDASGSTMFGPVILDEGKVVRPSQLIASVRRTSAVWTR